MRSLLAVLIGTMVSCGGAAKRPLAPAWKGSVVTQATWHVVDLPGNQLRLVILPDPSVATVSVVTHLRVGGKDDPVGQAGLAHLAEHAAYLIHAPGDAATLGARLDEVAVWENAETSATTTTFMASALPGDLEAVLALEAQRLAGDCATIDPAQLVVEREVVLNELREIARGDFGATPAVYLPGAQPLGGTELGVAALGTDDVCPFIKRFYNPAAAVVVVAGPVTIEGAYAAVEKTFGAIAARDEVAPAPPPGAEGFAGEVIGGKWRIDAEVVQAIYRLDLAPGEGQVQADLVAAALEQALDAAFHGPEWARGLSVDANLGLGRPLLIVTYLVGDGYSPIVSDLDDWIARQVDDWLAGKPDLLPRKSRLAAVSEAAQLSIEGITDRAQRFAELIAVLEPEQVVATFAPYAPTNDDLTTRLRAAIHSGARLVWLEPEEGSRKVKRADHQGERPSADQLLRELHAAGDTGTSLDLPGHAHPERNRRRVQLDNGLTVVMEDTGAASAVVSAVLRVDVGYAHDPTRAVAAEQLYYAPTLVASEDHAVTDDATYFTISDVARDLPALLQVVRELAFAPRHRPSWTNISNARMLRNASNVLRRRLFGADHPYGQMRGVVRKGMAKDGVGGFRRSHYRPDNAVLYLVGRFDLDAAVEQIHYALDDWPTTAAATPVEIPAPAPRPGTVLFTSKYAGAQVDLELAFSTGAATPTDQAALRVLSQVIARRTWDLRARQGVTYTPKVRHVQLRHAGYHRISLTVDDRAAAETITTLDQLLADLRQHGPTAAELVSAQRAVIRELLAGDDTSAGRASGLAEGELLGYGDDLDELLRQIAAVTLDQVRARAAVDLADTGRVLLIHGTPKAVDALRKAVDLGDTEDIAVPDDD